MIEQRIIQSIEDKLNLERWFEMGGPGSGHWRHAGRKGKRGGSTPSKGKVISHHMPLRSPGVETLTERKSNAAISSWFDEGLADPLGLGEDVWAIATDQDRANLKAQVARDLAAASGVTEQEAADFVKQWAHSSNDDDMRSLAIQQDAAKEFGVNLSDFTKENIKINQEDLELKKDLWGGKIPERIQHTVVKHTALMESDKQRALLRSMYNETQAELKARGITEVRLSRGVKLDRSVDPKLNKPIVISTNAVESWSISRSVARDFATHYDPGQRGVVFESVIPAERILSVPATGFGCLTEGEVIVIGGVEGDIATVSDRF